MWITSATAKLLVLVNGENFDIDNCGGPGRVDDPVCVCRDYNS